MGTVMGTVNSVGSIAAGKFWNTMGRRKRVMAYDPTLVRKGAVVAG